MKMIRMFLLICISSNLLAKADNFCKKVNNCPLIINIQATNQTICEGDNASFSVTVNNSNTSTSETYQWQSSTDGTTWNDENGETNATLNLNSVAVADNGKQYRAIVSFDNGITTCELTSDVVTLTVETTPTVDIIEDNQSVCASETSITLNSTSNGTVNWTTDGNGSFAINTGTSTTYTIDITDEDFTITATSPTVNLCPAVSETIDISILKIDCITFPWSGN